jgi:hypothetical protein
VGLDTSPRARTTPPEKRFSFDVTDMAEAERSWHEWPDCPNSFERGGDIVATPSNNPMEHRNLETNENEVAQFSKDCASYG